VKTTDLHATPRTVRTLAAGLILTTLCGCGALRPATPHPAFYTLGYTAGLSGTPPPGADGAPTLIVNPPHAAAGYDSPRIIYVREPYQLQYFVHSEWADLPARMLAPLLVSAIGQTGAFRAVVLTPSAAAGDLRLDTEIVRLQHEFNTTPSRVRFTLRAYVVDDRTRRTLAWGEFEATADAASDDPYGGVTAANQAVQAVLERLATFCAETAAKLKALPPETLQPGRSGAAGR
jgi:cholesterol transport system auxiliary component